MTVLFCDLANSTEIAQAIDAEPLRALALRYFEAMRGVVVDTSTLVGTFMPADEWMVNVTDISALDHALGGPAFEPGPALAVALVLITAQGRAHVLRERWHESVTITV